MTAQTLPEQIGIGRPFTGAPFEAFQEAFDRVMPAGANFNPWEVPGINYVTYQEFDEVARKNIPRRLAGPWAREMIASMVTWDLLSVTATEPASFTIEAVRLRQNEFGSTNDKIAIGILDYEDPYYGTGARLLGGEKRIVRQDLGLGATSSGVLNPRMLVWIKLGRVTGDGDKIRDRLGDLKQALGAKTTLQGVDLVTPY